MRIITMKSRRLLMVMMTPGQAIETLNHIDIMTWKTPSQLVPSSFYILNLHSDRDLKVKQSWPHFIIYGGGVKAVSVGTRQMVGNKRMGGGPPPRPLVDNNKYFPLQWTNKLIVWKLLISPGTSLLEVEEEWKWAPSMWKSHSLTQCKYCHLR